MEVALQSPADAVEAIATLGLPPPLVVRARAAAQWIRERQELRQAVTIVHHIDADGLSAAAIAKACLERAGISHTLLDVKSLDALHLGLIHASQPESLWFCDLGSTAYMHFPDTPRLVCDHHELVRDGTEETFAHLNPLLDELSGSDISGAGCAFLAALALDNANAALAPLALVGATGDLQDRGHGGVRGFHGPNADILALALRLGLVTVRHDLAYFGPETRPLRKFLALAREPAVPGATGDARTAEAFLETLRLGHRAEEPWSAVPEPDRLRIRSALATRLAHAGLAAEVPRLWRPVVTVASEAVGAPTRELQEYATLLNSTARYGRPDAGLAVLRGERGAAYTQALELLLDHRKHLVGALDALARCGITHGLGIQHAHLEDRVRDTVVGIVCGMALEGLGLRRDLVMVGLAWTPDGRTKASARCPAALAGRVDLATAMRDSAAAVGGQGGGHRGAAGATIPRSAEAPFLAALDACVASQLGVSCGPQA